MSSPWLWSRPLVPLTLALAAGMATPDFFSSFSFPWSFGLITVLLLLLGLGIRQRWPLGWLACLLFFFLGQGLVNNALNPPMVPGDVRSLPHHRPISLMGVVSSRPLLRGTDYNLDLDALAWHDGQAWRPAVGLVRLMGMPGPEVVQSGETIVAHLQLRPVSEGKTPEAQRWRRTPARQQIFVTARPGHKLPPLQLAGRPQATGPTAWRAAIRGSWYQYLASQPQPARSLFLALLLGDQSEISPELRQNFQRTGTSHLLAISGLHLGMIAAAAGGVIFWFLRRWAWLLLRLNALKTAILLAALPMGAYVWLAGGSPATQRAALMILAGLLLLVLDRPRDTVSLLALAAFLILVISPLQLYALSFQLSFLSVWGLAVLSPGLMEIWRRWVLLSEERPYWLRQIVFWLGRGLTTTVAATLATLPVILAVFHQTPTYGIIVNLVVVPLMGFVVLPLGFLAMLLVWLPVPLAALLLAVARTGLTVCLWCIDVAANLPGVTLRLPAPTLWQMAAYFVILGSLLWSSRRFWRWLGVSAGVLFICLTVGWSVWSSRLQGSLEVTAAPGPEQLALVASFPGGAVMVINAGQPGPLTRTAGADRELLSLLASRQRLHLDYVLALTVTAQNAATLLALVRDFEVGEFWFSGDRPPLPAWWELRNFLGDNLRPVKNLALGQIHLTIGGVQVQTRQLPGNVPGGSSGPVLLQMDYRGRRLLAIPPGPANWRERCLAAGLPRSDVLFLPAWNLHQDFVESCLQQVQPQILVVTGAPTAAGHMLLARQKPKNLYLGSQGAVTLTVSANDLTIRP